VSPADLAIAFATAVVAGAINSVAGGGTLLTYPTLNLYLHLPSKMANATNTMALWPAALAGAWGFRETRPPSKKIVAIFVLISAVGAMAGAKLLQSTPESQFKVLVPWLILMAAMLLLLQGPINRLFGVGTATEGPPQEHRSKLAWAVAFFFQFFVGVYGGYFGAGIGIIMLAALSFMHVGDIYHMNFLKNFGALAINFSAALLLGIWGMVDWPLAVVMCLGALIGGHFGAGYAKKIGPQRLRAAISMVGLAIAVYMIIKQFSAT